MGGEGINLEARKAARHQLDFAQCAISAAAIGGDACLIAVHGANHAEERGRGFQRRCGTLYGQESKFEVVNRKKHAPVDQVDAIRDAPRAHIMAIAAVRAEHGAGLSMRARGDNRKLRIADQAVAQALQPVARRGSGRLQQNQAAIRRKP